MRCLQQQHLKSSDDFACMKAHKASLLPAMCLWLCV